ncbi:unnamed protein product [Ectocarpus sp. 6 AP-2014]
MAGKEAIVFLVDCNASMGGHMELARRAVRVLMVQKMLQSKQHEVGVVLFGLPEAETANQLNEAENSDYLGVKEYCLLDKGSVAVLRKVEAMNVPDSGEPATGDLLDAMVVGMHMIRSRTLKKKYIRHVYLLTDAATPVAEVSQLGDIVGMYTDPTMECRLHFMGFGHGAPAEEGGDTVKEQNEKMLASVAAATRGTVVPAQTVVDLMGESTIKTTNPVLSKVDLSLGANLTLHCRFFKKTDTGLKESLKKESIVSYDPAGGSGSDGKVRVDKTYRDPEMPEVEVDFEHQVKGFRYGQDYIPVNSVDEGSLKLPDEPPSLKVLGFTPSSSVERHFYMDDTFVLLPEPGSGQAAGAISSLSSAMRNLDQVAVARFVRRKSGEPWLGILIPDSTGVVLTERLLFQKIPFIEDVRAFNFPSLAKPPPSRTPSDEQKRVSASLVEAMMIPELDGNMQGGVRGGLVLDPVRQGVNGAKVARAMDPECELPDVNPSVKAALAPEPQLLDRAKSVLEEYRETFVFEKQERAKGAGQKRVIYFSDLTLAEPEKPTAGDGSPSKKRRTETSGGSSSAGAPQDKQPVASSMTTRKVGSIDPVSDFQAMMASAIAGDEGGPELADLAVQQMQAVIHTLVRKGTTSSLRAKAVSCVKALRAASVTHIMGQRYNDFLAVMKAKYQRGDNSDIWEMAMGEKGTWPITSEDDASLSMTPESAAEFMKAEEVKQEEEEAEEEAGDDDDLDDMA